MLLLASRSVSSLNQLHHHQYPPTLQLRSLHQTPFDLNNFISDGSFSNIMTADTSITTPTGLSLPSVLVPDELPDLRTLCLFTTLILVVAATAWLYLRLYNPIVHPYPWKLAPTSAQRLSDKKKKVVLAGSYNPPHRGHVAMLEYLAERYGEVIAVVGMNPNKKYDVTPQQRADFIRTMVQADGNIKENVRVEVVEGYIWRFAYREGVSLMFRGIRSWEKDGNEERYLHFLNTWGPMVYGPLKWPLPTQFLEGKPEYNHISSTLIRSLCIEAKKKGHKADLSALVPEEVADGVAKAYC